MSSGPIRQKSSLMYVQGGVDRPGMLLLYPDRLAFVPTGAAFVGVAAGGLIGSFIGEAVAKSRAQKKVDEGDPSVVTMMLGDIAQLRKGREGFNKKVLEVVMAGGDEHRFSMRFDRWAPAIAEALAAAGGEARLAEDRMDVVRQPAPRLG